MDKPPFDKNDSISDDEFFDTRENLTHHGGVNRLDSRLASEGSSEDADTSVSLNKQNDDGVESRVGDVKDSLSTVASLDKAAKQMKKKESLLKWSALAREVISTSSSQDEDDSSGSGSTSSSSPGLERKISGSHMLDDIAQGNLANWDPETCVTLLRMPTVSNYSGMKKLIEVADESWLEDFLSLDGLGILFEALERLSEKKFSSIADAILQLECVLCIKAVMNAKSGLEYIVSNEDYTRKLAKSLDSKNMLVKKQVFELMSALCVYSEKGHSLALDSLNNYKVSERFD
ncbi:Inverted formin-2 [Halocaridina rubra]|uniref:Inverted formin-2 n=1 Tax=Halocaridina rubra TaxID=373956 RepID=A0AAN9A031_HALRR